MKVKEIVSFKGCYSAHDVGEREIGLCRDKLLFILKEAYSDYQHNKISENKSGAEHMADLLIAAEKELIVFKETENANQKNA